MQLTDDRRAQAREWRTSRMQSSKPGNRDTEIHNLEPTRSNNAARDRLSYTLFGAMNGSKDRWPGLDAYLNYVEQQIRASGPECFLPLWQTFQWETPATMENSFDLLNSIAIELQGAQGGSTVDGILQSLLVPFSQDIVSLDPRSRELCRQAIFKGLSWLTMLFNASRTSEIGKFRMDVPLTDVGLREFQAIDMSQRPISRLIRGFGPLWPSSEQISTVLEASHTDLLYASSLNIFSLKLVDKVRVQWTSSLGCHLMFNPLARTLLVYSFPTFCALHCLDSRTHSFLDIAMHEYSDSPEVTSSVLAALGREVILSYRLLFGQDPRSRKEFLRIEKRKVTTFENQHDALLDVLCGKAVAGHAKTLPREIWPESCVDEDGKLLEQDVYSVALEFPILGPRLLKIQNFDLRQRPSRVRDLWRDRRNPLQCDRIYSEQWQSAIRRSFEGHEPQDLRRLKADKRYTDVQADNATFQESSHWQICDALSVIKFSLVPLEITELFLKREVEAEMDTRILWSSLSLVIEICAQEERAIAHLSRFLKILGHRIDLFNTYCSSDTKIHQLKQAAIDIFVETLDFSTRVIHFLRSSNDFERNKEGGWNTLSGIHELNIKSIDEALGRVEKHVRFAGRILSHEEEVQRLQVLLSLTPANFTDNAALPCVNLPVARNARFFDRDGIINKIDAYFFDRPEDHRFRSLTLFGLGGVGKSYVALKYSHGKTSFFSAILWIQSETAISLEQSFSGIALRLKLAGAEAHKHEENRILVLDCKWLLVFDNAESLDLLLRYWPVADQGCALITTRNHALAFEPAEAGIEIFPFDPDVGSAFILHLLRSDIAAAISSENVESAQELSKKLGGHALAISQMAGIIHRRSWSISEFVAIYDRNTKEMLGMPGHNSIDAVWKISFKSLNLEGATMLGVLSYLMPDSIPQALFEPSHPEELPTTLEFCSHELVLSDVIDDLLTLALIKRDKETRTLSLHRLVQTQFCYYVSALDNQKAFEETICLLYEAFPQSDAKQGQLYDRWAQCQLYLQHVLSLKNKYKEAAGGQQTLQPNLRFFSHGTSNLFKSMQHHIDGCRFLLESASYVELKAVLEVARMAFAQLKPEEQDQALLSDLCASSGLMWAHRGLFDLAEPLQRQAHQIRYDADPLDRLELSWTEVNMGNLDASFNRYEESLGWQVKALRNRQIAGGDDYFVMKPQGLLFQNLGRSNYLAGKFQEAHIWCHIAIGVLTDSQNWAMLA
ncbi:hypothetical protein MMC25_002828 [Agyrium rufum]|nr:hypothetical protein [Agyrium rufum]